MSRRHPEKPMAVALYKRLYNVDDRVAEQMFQVSEAAYSAGLSAGRAEAQRFYRVAFGIEPATLEETVLWNIPVPMKGP